MQTRITAPFTLRQYDIVHCRLQGISHALIVSNTKDRLFGAGDLVYIVPAFPHSITKVLPNPTVAKRGVLVKGHRGNYHQINLPNEDDLWLATGLLRAVTKGKIVGHGPIASLREDLRPQVQAQLREQLGL